VAELARGNINDRPWGFTFAALGLRGLTGQLNVFADGRTYSVAFDQGAVVGAMSPVANDAAIRVALQSNLVSPSQANDLTRRMQAALGQGRDEVDVLAEAARLAPEHAARLRRRLIAQRAARTFALERGDFNVQDNYTIHLFPECALDVRTIVYLGARTNVGEQRMAEDLKVVGAWMRLKREAVEDLPQYGFTETEKPVLEKLVRGGNLVDLVGDPDLDARMTRTVIYALACCGACELDARPRSSEPPRSMDDVSTTVRRDPIAPEDIPTQPRVPRSAAPPPAVQATGPIPIPANKTPSGAIPRPKSSTQPPPAARAKASTAATAETEKLIADMVPLMEQGADHFALLGIDPEASAEAIRKTYFNLARKLHPDRLASLGIADPKRNAQRLFAQINTAFGVLSDPIRREEYSHLIKRGGASAVREEEARAEELAMRVMRAEEVFKQGELALRRDQVAQALALLTEACELQPQEVEYQGLLAWAKFASAPDKNALASTTRNALLKASEKAAKPETALFYLGRVERILGRDKEALSLFQQVLMHAPRHAEAASEARVIEQRLRGKR
jgi:DnaJ-domain-containing protein 1